MPKLPVVAAIPNYNMAAELDVLLPQLTKQGYADIFVLDDGSTDNSREVVKRFKDVTFVEGKTNKGAGGNRNRVINALQYDAIIHFLDADVVIETPHTAQAVQNAIPDGPFGFVVGLTKTPGGLQNVWNYGAGPGLWSDIGAQMQMVMASQLVKHPDRAKRLRRLFGRMVDGWPDPLSQPIKRKVYWGIEQNLMFRSDTFAEFGGFNESFRETEILELALRMHKKGLPCYFDPSVAIRHTEGKVRHYNRNLVKAKDMLRIDYKYGPLRWLVSNGKIRP